MKQWDIVKWLRSNCGRDFSCYTPTSFAVYVIKGSQPLLHALGVVR